MTVNSVEQIVPGMVTQSEELLSSRNRIQKKGIDVRERLDSLRQSIQKTRELANKIKVGIDFDPSTTIELKNPDDLIASATATKVIEIHFSLFIICFHKAILFFTNYSWVMGLHLMTLIFLSWKILGLNGV